MERILVTGADGFVGARLCSRLAEHRFRVTGAGLLPQPEAHGYEYLILDIMDEDRLNTLIHDTRPALIFHMAAIASTRIAERSLHHAASLNTLAVVNLMKFAAEAVPGCRIFLFSTGEVYGPNPDRETLHTEESPIADPMNFYTATKIAQEYYARILARILALPLVIIRPFSLTGPGQSENFVLGSWGAQVARIRRGLEEPVIRVGELGLYRDFTDVRDAVRAAVLLTGLDQEPGTYSIYNIASGTPYRLSDLLEMLIAQAGIAVEVQVDESRLRRSDYPVFAGLSARLRSAAGWSPEIPIEQSLRDIIACCEKGLTAS